MDVVVIKPFRHSCRIFEVGEVGETVEVEYPLKFGGVSLYDFYVKFPGYPPVGVRESEVEEVKT